MSVDMAVQYMRTIETLYND